ncbi:MAG: hypothetical protein JXA11_09830 [Phycisphaerae bacterium]|nr:hypothetical protein [Phycisphaerae bacterium]
MLAEWTVTKTVVLCVPIGLLLVAGVTWILLRKTVRTRLRVARQLRDDPDINEYLVVFDFSRKVLYVPTILASLTAGVLMLFFAPAGTAAYIVGGCWLAVFFLNFLIDEYELSVKLIFLILLAVLLVALWLTFLGWLMDVLRAFGHLRVAISAAGYFVIAGIFLLAIGISFLRGLFYYIAVTPNYMNIQTGPTETGDQINHTEYSTRIDTGDFLERLMGFGRLVVTFRDQRRPPLILLVNRIGQKAKHLEAIRGTLSLDRHIPAAGQGE